MNICIFTGNLTRDVEVKDLPNDTSVANFTIAVSRQYKKRSGETEKEVAFLDCEAWDSGGKTIAKNFRKGSKITVQCEVKQETWEDKTDGKKRSKLKFRVTKFFFADSKPREEEPDFGGESNTAPVGVSAKEQDNIPF